MRTIKNCPAKYLKRSDLGDRPVRVGGGEYQTREPRDFAKAEIDQNFYVTFRPSRETVKSK